MEEDTIDHRWLTSTVVGLARRIHESNDLSLLVILADALEETGCDDQEILNHLRGSDHPHIHPDLGRCYVVNDLLGAINAGRSLMDVLSQPDI